MSRKNYVGKQKRFASAILVTAIGLTGCASTNPKKELEKSFLADDGPKISISENQQAPDRDASSGNMKRLTPLDRQGVELSSTQLSERFADEGELNVSVNNMPTRSFLHNVLGELLNVDYVIGNEIDNSAISLNIVNKITPRKLFELTAQLLQERGVGLRFKDDIYYVYQIPSGGKGSVVMGFGRDEDAIPQSSGNILQVVPLKYGIRVSVERTLRGLVDAEITTDFEQSALFIRGRRDQVVRALDLIRLLDVPANRGKYIALISPVYMSTNQFVESVTELLQTEGIDIGRSPNKQENLVFVPIAQLGSIAVFSAEQALLERVEFWAKQIDKPSKGSEKQYHVYTPKFARASDLGESLAPLIGGASSIGPVSDPTTAKDSQSSAQANNSPQSASVSNDKMSMVIDRRSNTLIFHASGTDYQAMLPLIQRMDTMPKQVLLSVTIAEVTLTGVFRRGFEFALNSGNFTATTEGSLGLSDITGFNLNWSSGLNEVMSKFVEENSYVNILSKPSILVRDGTEATINVGNRIPVSAGSTTGSNGDVVTENISFRETGINLVVSPTINAQGVVIMKITQDISNQVANQVGKGGNPIFFERKLTTEVVADSGQTILLGGLISEDVSNSDTGVPFMKSIPLLGALFESASKTNEKTELVIMVTPKIVERSNQWQHIMNSFQNVLENIDIRLQN
ncbi:hypothetical protein [Thalassotalea montiporae]